jgi:hypothetical protein
MKITILLQQTAHLTGGNRGNRDRKHDLRSLLFKSALLLSFASATSFAATHYVDVNSTNAAPPYTNWTTAATNIQDAVDVAVAGDEVVVTNGIYAGGVSSIKPLTVRSVSGPQFTTISGGGPCVSLATGETLSGFTVRDGVSLDGGGVFCSANSVVSDCIIASNTCYEFGGGAFGGTLNNCIFIGNQAFGGVWFAYGGGAANSVLNNCTLVFNSADSPNSVEYECTLNNCIAYNNRSLYYGCGDCGGGQLAAGNNWYGDPLFVDRAGRLQSNSPCINAGNKAFAPAGPDLDGNPRIVGGTVDIGAYEYQSLSLINFSVVSNQAGFSITGQSNQVVTVETSSDLVNWSPLATNTLNGHPFSFSDPTPASVPQRFYRAQPQ